MKNNLHIPIVLLVGIFFGVYNGHAQTKMPNKDTVRMIQLKKNQRIFFDSTGQNDSIQRLKKSREFSYMNYLDSLLRTRSNMRTDTTDFEESNSRIIPSRTNESDFSSLNRFLNRTPVKIFFWMLAFLFVGFISYQIFFKNKIPGGSRKTSSESEGQSLPPMTNLFEYDALIGESEAGKDYRLAIRYWFLKTLKNLADKGIVEFSVEKTNHQYVSEVKAREHAQQFESLSRNYEFIWYGKFIINENTYLQLKNEFDLFNQKI